MEGLMRDDGSAIISYINTTNLTKSITDVGFAASTKQAHMQEYGTKYSHPTNTFTSSTALTRPTAGTQTLPSAMPLRLQTIPTAIQTSNTSSATLESSITYLEPSPEQAYHCEMRTIFHSHSLSWTLGHHSLDLTIPTR